MSDKFKIESGVPITSRCGSELSQTVRKMKAGESFVFPKSKRDTIASTFNRIIGSKGYSIRSIDESTARVWRLK